uniref:Uncharacterized protein n=1 Tax=Anguilla anguilla TaxID=7936 RepID=A0A0E9S7B8_ANGAN
MERYAKPKEFWVPKQRHYRDNDTGLNAWLSPVSHTAGPGATCSAN